MILESAVGQKVLAGTVPTTSTPSPLSSSSIKSKFGFTIQASNSNGSDTVFIGGANVSVSGVIGFQLTAGQTVKLDIEDLANIFAASSGTNKVNFLGVG